MPERLDEWPKKPTPYDEFMDGSMWKVSHDEYPQYKSVSAVRTAFLAAAKRKHLIARTVKMDNDSFAFQVTNPPKSDESDEPLKGTRLRAVAREERG